ncbi:MAG: rhodanese-like domain-containing protein [Gammaproteobacteria bacterium]
MDSFIQFITNHWPLASAFVGILVILMVYEYYSLQKEGKAISTAQAIEKINHFSAVVVDLRHIETYKKGHIIGAINATANDFQSPKMQAYRDKPLILVCARGIESQSLVPKLHKQGFSQVMSMAGGMSAWQSAHLPVVVKK